MLSVTGRTETPCPTAPKPSRRAATLGACPQPVCALQLCLLIFAEWCIYKLDCSWYPTPESLTSEFWWKQSNTTPLFIPVYEPASTSMINGKSSGAPAIRQALTATAVRSIQVGLAKTLRLRLIVVLSSRALRRLF